jgi:hypothetical protein
LPPTKKLDFHHLPLYFIYLLSLSTLNLALSALSLELLAFVPPMSFELSALSYPYRSLLLK